jgi:hypothetical protein
VGEDRVRRGDMGSSRWPFSPVCSVLRTVTGTVLMRDLTSDHTATVVLLLEVPVLSG